MTGRRRVGAWMRDGVKEGGDMDEGRGEGGWGHG